MKRLWTMMLIGFALLGLSAATAAAATPEKPAPKPFTGTFEGIIYGSNNSSTAIILELEQEKNHVIGTAFIDEGLYINAGNCGGAYVPATTETAVGNVSTKNPNLLSAETNLNVSGINVTIDFIGELDEDVLDLEAKIDLPWLCGKDPLLHGTVEKLS